MAKFFQNGQKFPKWPKISKIPKFQNSKIKNFGKILEKIRIKDIKPIKIKKKILKKNL